MSVQAMSWVFQHSGAQWGARLVLLAIANHADKDGQNSWASVGQLAEEAHLSVRQVRRALRELERSGEVIEVAVSPKRTHVYELPGMASLFQGGQSDPDNMTPVTVTPGHIVPSRGTNRTAEGVISTPEPSRTVLNRPTTTSTAAFEAFFKAYPGPRKGARRPVRKAWDRAIRRAAPDVIKAAAERLRDDPNRIDEYTPAAATWLNRDGWEEGPLPPRKGQREVEPRRPSALLAAIDLEERYAKG